MSPPSDVHILTSCSLLDRSKTKYHISNKSLYICRSSKAKVIDCAVCYFYMAKRCDDDVKKTIRRSFCDMFETVFVRTKEFFYTAVRQNKICLNLTTINVPKA